MMVNLFVTCSVCGDCSGDSRTRNVPSHRTRSSGRSDQRGAGWAGGRNGSGAAYLSITLHARGFHRSL